MRNDNYQFICTFGAMERDLDREYEANEAIEVAVCLCSEQVSEYQVNKMYW